MNDLQKIPRFASPKYLQWVRTLPCVICRRPGWSENQIVPHHIKGVGHFSGGALKAGDHLAMPMHSTCHAVWHQKPNYEQQWEWVACTASMALVEIAEGRLKL